MVRWFRDVLMPWRSKNMGIPGQPVCDLLNYMYASRACLRGFAMVSLGCVPHLSLLLVDSTADINPIQSRVTITI